MLQTALEKVKPGLSKAETIQQSNNFAFFHDRVVTYNDEISISCPVPDMDITGAVKAEEMYKFINKATSELVDIDISGSELLIRSGRAKAGLAYNPEVELPLTELGEIEDQVELPEDFMFGMTSVLFCVGNDMTRPRMTCVHCREDGILEACDNARFIQYRMKDVLPEFLIPGSSVRELLKYNVNTVGFSEGWIHFNESSGLRFSCRLSSDQYADLDKLIKDIGKGTALVFPDGLDAVLSRAQIFVAKSELKSSPSVDVTVEGRKMIVKAASAAGWFEEWLKLDEKTPECAFSTNPAFLQDILKRNSTCQFFPQKFVIFKGENWLHVASLQAKVK